MKVYDYPDVTCERCGGSCPRISKKIPRYCPTCRPIVHRRMNAERNRKHASIRDIPGKERGMCHICGAIARTPKSFLCPRCVCDRRRVHEHQVLRVIIPAYKRRAVADVVTAKALQDMAGPRFERMVGAILQCKRGFLGVKRCSA